jgi:alpha-L-arabinofuranosidase
MFSRNYHPLLVQCQVQGSSALDINAKRSDNGKTLVLQVVNATAQSVPSTIQLNAFIPSHSKAQVEELAGPLQAANTAAEPNRVKPRSFAWDHRLQDGKTELTFAPHSFTIIRFE